MNVLINVWRAIKWGELLHSLNKCKLLKRGSTLCRSSNKSQPLLLGHFAIHNTQSLCHSTVTKLSLCLIKHRVMETYRQMEVQAHAFLTSALGGGEWHIIFAVNKKPLSKEMHMYKTNAL